MGRKWIKRTSPSSRRCSTRSSKFPRDLWTPTLIAAYVLNQAKRFGEAEGYARESLAVAPEAHLPEADPRTAESLFELGRALQGEKKYSEAASTTEKSAAMYDRLGPAWARRAAPVGKKLSEMPVRR
jgi:tetratricopeptide (TPR) repeat protein